MPDKKLNILFLSSWYPNRVIPTLGNFVQKHAEAVALHSNVSALYVCSDSACTQPYEIVTSTVSSIYTVNVYYKKVEHGIPIIAPLQKAIRYIRAHGIGLKKIKSNFGSIDIVHHNILYPAGIIAWWLKKTKGIPYIITENWTGYLSSKNIKLDFITLFLSKMIAQNASYITPVSRDLRDSMMKLGFKSNYEIVYNVVDTHLFHPPEIKEQQSKIKFLHVSTLDDPHKNISGMLRVLSDLAKQRTDFAMFFIGEGDKEEYIKNARMLGIYNSFSFFEGVKSTVEIAAIMRHTDCFVMFSNYENLPCVIIEALASGLPIVSSTAGGIPEHIDEQKGMLMLPRDENGLLWAMNKTIIDIQSRKYNASELADYAKDNFSYEKVSEKFHELYYRILTDKKTNE